MAVIKSVEVSCRIVNDSRVVDYRCVTDKDNEFTMSYARPVSGNENVSNEDLAASIFKDYKDAFDREAATADGENAPVVLTLDPTTLKAVTATAPVESLQSVSNKLADTQAQLDAANAQIEQMRALLNKD